MITPTVGRVVLYHHDGQQGKDAGKQPHAALVSYVHSDRLINLAAFTANGNSYGVQSVRLLQDDDKPRDADEPFAEWMPYQKGQALKHEAREAAGA